MLDPFLQGQIIGMYKAGLKSRKIAVDLDVNDRTVRAIIKRFQERGTLDPKPIPGRPRKVPKIDGPATAVKGEGGEEVGGENATSLSATAMAPVTVVMKNGRVVKKRGPRGPYKKKNRVDVVQAPEPVPVPVPGPVPVPVPVPVPGPVPVPVPEPAPVVETEPVPMADGDVVVGEGAGPMDYDEELDDWNDDEDMYDAVEEQPQDQELQQK
ncbi:hypothetical protein BGX33_009497 [Mortierella sp. NVP41]|nr:hypothetical protein BGX33_009497 [Mortierella sp. NVP41]